MSVAILTLVVHHFKNNIPFVSHKTQSSQRNFRSVATELCFFNAEGAEIAKKCGSYLFRIENRDIKQIFQTLCCYIIEIFGDFDSINPSVVEMTFPSSPS